MIHFKSDKSVGGYLSPVAADLRFFLMLGLLGIGAGRSAVGSAPRLLLAIFGSCVLAFDGGLRSCDRHGLCCLLFRSLGGGSGRLSDLPPSIGGAALSLFSSPAAPGDRLLPRILTLMRSAIGSEASSCLPMIG